MAFSKNKTGKVVSSGLSGRLKDRRRRIALGAVAAGAAVAAVFRRKRRGEGARVEQTAERIQPVAGAMEAAERAPSAPAESGPPPAVDVPTTASEPEVEVAPGPVAPTVSPKGPANSAPASSASGSIAEPATGELSAEEASILSVLAQSGRKDDDRTAIAIATSLERETTDVAGVLRKLGNEGVVSGDLYTAAGDKIWAVTERGVRRLGAQS